MSILVHEVVVGEVLSVRISDAQPRRVLMCHENVVVVDETSALFAVEIDGVCYTAQSPALTLASVTQTHIAPGHHRASLHFHHHTAAWHVVYTLDTFAQHAVIESGLVIHNHSEHPLRVTRMDAWDVVLPIGSYETMAYSSGWGSEFEPIRHRLTANYTIQGRAGRSSQGMSPVLTLWRDARVSTLTTVAWSGNWAIDMTQQPNGAFRLSAGINTWAFWSDVAPGATCSAPPVVTVFGNGDVDGMAQQLARVGQSYWYPHNTLADALPVEWNHWWTYEDRAINEVTFRANVDVAAELGFEVCVVDAGWFGPADPHTHWYQVRGDWHLVNTTRFPSGMRALSDYVHAKGMAFGIWCEIEALGVKAEVSQLYPDIVALRDGIHAGYVCLGSQAGWEFAFNTLDRIIGEYNADWVKLDFNLDPGAGCNRTDHGHGAGDGLFHHYHGYYRLLAAIRAKYPHVVLENCSSGGLRIDLGIAKQTHMAFLSDPDWPVHSLQLFWGASTFLAPTAILHWSFGEWGFADHPDQTFDPRSPSLTMAQLDYYTHISMLHRCGFSQGLPDLPSWVAERYATHIREYQQVVRAFVAQGVLYRLTNQPRRDRTWDLFAGFQYVLPGAERILLCLFRLPGAKAQKRFYFADIDATATYRCRWLGSQRVETWQGADMAGGVMIADLPEPGSAFILCERIPAL